jgi:hypothetical protein
VLIVGIAMVNAESWSEHRLMEVELTAEAVAAVVRFSRDEGHAVRLAAARAAGHLALAELRGDLAPESALAPLVPVMVALVGTDQSSDVQRQMLLVRRQHMHHTVSFCKNSRHRALSRTICFLYTMLKL